MKKPLLLAVATLAAFGSLHAETVTLPAAASIQGGSPFFSDVRAFNTSYTASLDVTGTYRCFIATVACPATAPQIHFTLGPRESRAFNDICADAFGSPDTAGGVEFEFGGAEEQLVVTSRLYSTSPYDSVGMFIPGLEESAAFPTTVLTSVRYTPPNSLAAGFRTNVGAFNPGDSTVTLSFTIYDGGTNRLGVPVTRTLAGHAGLQVSGIFEVAGASTASTENAVIVVAASAAVFSYAAVLDNATADPIFVVGAEDQPPQPTTPVSTVTPATPTPTTTPVPSQTFTVNVGGAIGGYIDVISGTSTSTIHVNDTVKWVWQGGNHSVSSGPCCAGEGDRRFDEEATSQVGHTFSYHFTEAGSYTYFCEVHREPEQGTVIVTP